ncbi:MAG: YdeI/OmpD-associated family protein [Planctomycetaceae bacterium]|nr:YdeI/OmpD-associated family protein [Planctomycetaceae bacterium]
MANARNPKVDAYIAKAAPFARPILSAIRERVLGSGVELEETLKWNSPSWTHGGKLLCGMAAFKAHCVFGFWHKDMQAEIEAAGKSKVGVGGIHRERLVELGEVPSASAMKKLMKKAVELALSDKPALKRSGPKPEAAVPEDLARALARNKAAAAQFKAFTPGKRREYIEWITEAKREATRLARLEQALEWIAEGKPRNWKYENC